MVDKPKGDEKDGREEVEAIHAFMKDYGQTAIIILGVALALVLGFGAYRNYKKSTAMRASRMLMGAKTPEQLQQIITEYPSTPTAPLALLALGARYYDSGQYDLARFAYAQFEQKYPEHLMVDVAEFGKAQCLEAEGQLDEAMEAFEAFQSAHPTHYLAPLAIFGKGRCLTQLGRFSEARVEYEDFIAEHPQSGWVPLAESSLLFVDKGARSMQAGGKIPQPSIQLTPSTQEPIFLNSSSPAETMP